MKRPLIVLSTLALSLSLAASFASADPGDINQQGTVQDDQNGQNGDQSDMQGQRGDQVQTQDGQTGDQVQTQDGQSGEQGQSGELENESVLTAGEGLL